MKDLKKFISCDPYIQGGQPVFSGTRVPVQSLFWHLDKGASVDEFLIDFPSVGRHQVVGLLEIANKIFTSGKIEKLYEAVA